MKGYVAKSLEIRVLRLNKEMDSGLFEGTEVGDETVGKTTKNLTT